MSWEAWGAPPDEEQELCPICDNTQHAPDKCEIAASEEHSRKHYEGVIALLLQDRERRLTEAYAEGRKDEREQWEPVARLALAALNSCDGEDGYKGPQQWFNNEQVSDAIKKLCALICPVCLGAGWTADRVGEACPCGLHSWEARK
jgi:hypothetical protein